MGTYRVGVIDKLLRSMKRHAGTPVNEVLRGEASIGFGSDASLAASLLMV